MKHGLQPNLELAKASNEDDRTHILNKIVGKDLDHLEVKPPGQHDEYTRVNGALGGLFARPSLGAALSLGKLKALSILDAVKADTQ